MIRRQSHSYWSYAKNPRRSLGRDFPAIQHTTHCSATRLLDTQHLKPINRLLLYIYMNDKCVWICRRQILQFIQYNADSISSGHLSTLRTIFIHFNRQKLAVPQASVQEEWIQTPPHLPACCGRIEVKGLTHHLFLTYRSETRTCVITMIAEFG